MAIEKNSFKVSRYDSEFLPHSREIMSSDDDEIIRRNSCVESDDDDEFNDCDSGAGSDDFDLLELGEVGEEFCQVGDETCSIPFELYDLTGLGEVLSMDTWNDCLTEEERFSLTEYLPDMDQEMYMRTLKQLFDGSNLHFGSPIVTLFDMLKGGLCEPRVAMYRQGLISFQKRQHHHLVRKYHNSMVVNLHQIRDAWLSCNGYGIEEKLRVLNIVKSQKNLIDENMEELESDASGRNDLREGAWNKKTRPLNLNFPFQGKSTGLQEKLGKPDRKGKVKLAGTKMSSAKEVFLGLPYSHNGSEMKPDPPASYLGASSRENKASAYGIRDMIPVRDQMRDDYDDAEETMYDIAARRGHNSTNYFMDYPGSSMHDLHGYGSNKTVNKLSDIKVLTSKPSKTRISNDDGKKAKYPVNVQQFPFESQTRNTSRRGSPYDSHNGGEPFWRNNAHGGAFYAGTVPEYGQNKNWRSGMDSSLYFPELGAKSSRGNIRANTLQNGALERVAPRGSRRFPKSVETESDSSEPIDDDEDDNPLMRSKLAYPSEALNGSFLKSKKSKVGQKDKRSGARPSLDGFSQFSRKINAQSQDPMNPETEVFSLRAKQKGRMHGVSHLLNSAFNVSENNRFTDADEQKQVENLGKKSNLQRAYGSGCHVSTYPLERKAKEEFEHQYSVRYPSPLHDYALGKQEGSPEINRSADITGVNKGFGSDVPLSLLDKSKKNEAFLVDERIGNGTNSPQQLENTNFSRKRGKRKIDDHYVELELQKPELPITDMGDADREIEPKEQKKPFTPITPTVHSGLSFSVVHLLSAIRIAMVTLLPEDSLDVANRVDINESEHLKPKVPSLTVHEIVNRVRSNPGDPCILETQEPLLDMVRGVLRIFSFKSPPLGAKGWKSLVSFEKSTKGWSWVGPVPQSLLNNEVTEEVTSPEAWGLPRNMLVKLVDAFANWLVSSSETLRQIACLPPPPLSLMQFNADEKERFRDLRAQKSLNTISPSTEEVRAHFRREEFLRYALPDWSFSYTAVDGKKSSVAPLRRCGGKPTAKARDHPMLKPDRPPHVTILCLVRDAAARLPGKIGTRADVCTLIRDSQYIVQEYADVNQVVSGALDRLHYEQDPCVQFDGERKLWVYLHRDKEEEDYEEDGTTSTKKWKRPKKEAPEPSEQEMVTVAYHAGVEQTGLDLSSDLNAEPSCGDEDKRNELIYFDGNNNMEENVGNGDGSELGAMRESSRMAWDSLGISSLHDSKFLCQENSTNDDFEAETFVREPPDQILNTSLT